MSAITLRRNLFVHVPNDGGYRGEYNKDESGATGSTFLRALKWLDKQTFFAPFFAKRSLDFLFRFSYAADRLLKLGNGGDGNQ